MIQLADLLFYTNRNNELTFDKRFNLEENIVSTDYSFEQVLKKYQKSNDTSQNGISQSDHTEKDNQKVNIFGDSSIEHEIKEENNELDVELDEALEKIPVEWLLSLLTKQLGDSSISENGYIDTLKIIAPSLQKAMAQEFILPSVEVNENLRNILESLLLKMKTDVVEAGIDINQEPNITSDLKNTQYLDLIQDILTGKEHLYDSSLEAVPKQIMTAMQMAGMGKKALISYIDNRAINEGINNTDEQNNLVRLTEAENLDIKSVNLQDSQNGQALQKGIKIIQTFGENSNLENRDLNYNSHENELSNPQTTDMALVEPVNISSSTEILDITKMLDNNNSTASIEIIRDLAEKISVNLKNNHYEIELQVKPEHLGRLILKVTLEDGVLAGKIYTTSQQTGDILQNNLNDLRNALEEQGYSFSQLDVNVGNEGNAKHFQQPKRDGLHIGDTKNSMNILDHLDDQIEEDSKLVKNYTNSGKIDYFA